MRPTVPDRAGVLLLDKQPGVTSFQALYPVKRTYGTAVGHTGTLDLFASGLLVVLVGPFTRFNPLFTAFDKVYDADFTFGTETDTLDPSGAVVSSGPVPDDVPALAGRWVGELLQVPPDYSAVHVQGRRASDRMRQGQTLELPPRPVTVYSLDAVAWKSPVLTVRVHCSKGTYIRSLARDWGRAAGCGAHVTRLRRLSVGPFSLPPSGEAFLEAATVFQTLGLPQLEAQQDTVGRILHGQGPEHLVPELRDIGGNSAALMHEGQLLAVAQRKEKGWRYLFVARNA